MLLGGGRRRKKKPQDDGKAASPTEEEAINVAPTARAGESQNDDKAGATNNESSDEELETNPDPLYDPLQDDHDEEWLAKQRPAKGVLGSDAILNCPACFAPLCYDCQRNERYKNQFRAMFVSNLKVCEDEAVRPTEGDDDPSARYWNARCTECNCHVAVLDSDQVYHFFNVLANPVSSGKKVSKKNKPQKNIKTPRELPQAKIS